MTYIIDIDGLIEQPSVQNVRFINVLGTPNFLKESRGSGNELQSTRNSSPHTRHRTERAEWCSLFIDYIIYGEASFDACFINFTAASTHFDVSQE